MADLWAAHILNPKRGGRQLLVGYPIKGKRWPKGATVRELAVQEGAVVRTIGQLEGDGALDLLLDCINDLTEPPEPEAPAERPTPSFGRTP